MEELKSTQYLADDGVAFVEVGAADGFVGVAAGVEGGIVVRAEGLLVVLPLPVPILFNF